MKKIWIISLCLLSATWGIAQNKTNAKGQKEGEWKGYYDSKNLKYEGNFKNGKEVGVFRFYEDDKKNNLSATMDYSKDANLSYATFFIDGNKMSEGWYNTDKKKVGEWIYYHKGGERINSKEFYVNGILDGERTVYYKSGNISEIIRYKMGERHGESVQLSEDGIELRKEPYENGKLNGWAIYKNADGSLNKKGQFIHGELQGKWITK